MAAKQKMEKTPLKLRADYLQSLLPIVYQAGDETELSLIDFLNMYKPSETHSEDGIGWIEVRGQIAENESPEQAEPDIEGLLKKWDELMAAETEITAKLLKELAVKYNAKTGFWLFYVPKGPKGDILWRKIAIGIVYNNLNGCSYVATITSLVKNENIHVICVYNADATNDQEVFAVEKAIRDVGIEYTMKYKPDVYSCCGIYADNQLNIRPTILVSKFDVNKRESRLITHDGRVLCCNQISET